MHRRVSVLATLTGGCIFVGILGNQFAVAQDQGATGFAVVDGQRDGQDITGPYDVVVDWPKDLTILPRHEDWTWGAE